MSAKPTYPVIHPPFAKENQLYDSSSVVLPRLSVTHGAPQPRSKWPSTSGESLMGSLLSDICPIKLNELAPFLWMCSAPTSTNVPPLHNHAIHGRSIVVSEDPALHLVWTSGKIFIKPLPSYLLCHDFWSQHLLQDSRCQDVKDVREAALGFLRSYHHCVRHQSDFQIAQQSHLNLIPPGVSWKQWCDFSASFAAIQDAEVAPRYRYGKLQLSRLHWLVRIHLRELNYYYIDGCYGDSFARYYGPLLFVFGLLSVLLSAMQVGMAVEQLQSRQWTAFWSVCRWFSVTSLMLSAIVVLYLVVSFVVKSVDGLAWAVRAQYRARWRVKVDHT